MSWTGVRALGRCLAFPRQIHLQRAGGQLRSQPLTSCLALLTALAALSASGVWHSTPSCPVSETHGSRKLPRVWGADWTLQRPVEHLPKTLPLQGSPWLAT